MVCLLTKKCGFFAHKEKTISLTIHVISMLAQRTPVLLLWALNVRLANAVLIEKGDYLSDFVLAHQNAIFNEPRLDPVTVEISQA